MITLDIKDLYVNLHNIDNIITEEALHLLKVIVNKIIFSTTTNFSKQKEASPWDHPFQVP
jgi:hypothetical protein